MALECGRLRAVARSARIREIPHALGMSPSEQISNTTTTAVVSATTSTSRAHVRWPSEEKLTGMDEELAEAATSGIWGLEAYPLSRPAS